MGYKTVSVAGGRKKKVRVHKKIHFFRSKTAVLARNPAYPRKAVNALKEEARAPKVSRFVVNRIPRLRLCYNPAPRYLLRLHRGRNAVLRAEICRVSQEKEVEKCIGHV